MQKENNNYDRFSILRQKDGVDMATKALEERRREDRQPLIDRQTDRDRQTGTDRHTYRHTDIQTYIHAYIHTYIHTYTHTHIHKAKLDEHNILISMNIYMYFLKLLTIFRIFIMKSI